MPIVFEDQYFSVLNVYVESVLLDFRFRMMNFKSLQTEMQQFQQEKSSLQKQGTLSKGNDKVQQLKKGSTLKLKDD